MNEKEITHIDLFSGVGGFALAAKWAGFKTIAFCEKEEFCQRVLQKRFGAVIADTLCSISRRENSGKINNQSRRVSKAGRESLRSKDRETYSNKPKQSNPVPTIPEIRDLDGTKYRGATLLTGGFPCQPFSVAGKQKGKEDDRYLWPEMLRIINEAKPSWILAENVPGIFHLALDTVLADLEGEGYTTGTFIIPACSLNAPHKRNRIWIIANSIDSRMRRGSDGNPKRSKCTLQAERPNSDVTDTESRMLGEQAKQERGKDSRGGNIKDASDPKSNIRDTSGLSSREKSEDTRFGISDKNENGITGWEKDWHEVATQFCRVDDGVSNRIHRLKALGNAIVPQVAYEILKNIAWIERNLK